MYFQASLADSGTFNTSELQNDAQSEDCYEYLEATLEGTRSKLRFWVEGVFIFVIGCLGLLGNTVTVLVLRRYQKNRNFNILIIWWVIYNAINTK